MALGGRHSSEDHLCLVQRAMEFRISGFPALATAPEATVLVVLQALDLATAKVLSELLQRNRQLAELATVESQRLPVTEEC